jgi:hypothetical protein
MAEKLPRASRCYIHFRPGGRRYLKRQQARQERRAARLDPEGAPTRRVYSGWAD